MRLLSGMLSVDDALRQSEEMPEGEEAMQSVASTMGEAGHSLYSQHSQSVGQHSHSMSNRNSLLTSISIGSWILRRKVVDILKDYDLVIDIGGGSGKYWKEGTSTNDKVKLVIIIDPISDLDPIGDLDNKKVMVLSGTNIKEDILTEITKTDLRTLKFTKIVRVNARWQEILNDDMISELSDRQAAFSMTFCKSSTQRLRLTISRASPERSPYS